MIYIYFCFPFLCPDKPTDYYLTFLAAAVVSRLPMQYGLVAAILLLDVDTACLPEVGGAGC